MICPYDKAPARLTDSAEVYGGKSYGLIYLCSNYPKCDSYVGVHKNSKNNAPLGRMANGELRQWKMLAHEAFDGYWKGKMTRYEGYSELARRMGIRPSKAHIAMMDVEECRMVVNLFRDYKTK